MGLKIGKFLGRIASGAVKSVPAAVAGFAAGGPAGAGLALVAGTTFGGGKQTNPAGSPAMFSAAPATFMPGFGGPSFGAPAAIPVGAKGLPAPAAGSSEIFNAILKMADRLSIHIKSPNAVISTGRRILGKLIRFARATPGLTIVSMLANLGLSAIEANQLVTWYSTAGKRRRRIKITNIKALNRSVRRLEGFRRLAVRVESALARRGVSRGVVRVRRCPKCRKSACSC